MWRWSTFSPRRLSRNSDSTIILFLNSLKPAHRFTDCKNTTFSFATFRFLPFASEFFRIFPFISVSFSFRAILPDFSVCKDMPCALLMQGHKFITNLILSFCLCILTILLQSPKEFRSLSRPLTNDNSKKPTSSFLNVGAKI